MSKTYFTSSRYCIITQKQYCRLYSLNLSKTYFTCSRYCTKTQYRVLSVVLIEFVPRCNLSQVHFAKEKVFKDWNEATRKEMHSTNSFSLPLLPPSLPSSFLSVTKCPIHYKGQDRFFAGMEIVFTSLSLFCSTVAVASRYNYWKLYVGIIINV